MLPHKGRKIPPMQSSIISWFVSLKAEVSHASSRVALEKNNIRCPGMMYDIERLSVFEPRIAQTDGAFTDHNSYREQEATDSLSPYVLSSSRVSFVWKLMSTVRK